MLVLKIINCNVRSGIRVFINYYYTDDNIILMDIVSFILFSCNAEIVQQQLYSIKLLPTETIYFQFGLKNGILYSLLHIVVL